MCGDDLNMLRIHLGDHHWHVIGPTVGGVVGDHGTLGFGVPLLQSADFILLHINSTEYEVHQTGDFLHVGLSIHDNQALGLFRNGFLHGPTSGDSLLIGLSSRTGAGCDDCKLEPGMTLHQCDETLTNHTGSANDTYFILFHVKQPPNLSYIRV